MRLSAPLLAELRWTDRGGIMDELGYQLPYLRWTQIVRLGPRMDHGLHQLCDHMILYVLKGNGSVEIDSSIQPLTPDRAYFILPGMWYRMRAGKDDELLFLAVHFDWERQADSDTTLFFRTVDDPQVPFRTPRPLPHWPLGRTSSLELGDRPQIRRLLESVVASFNRRDVLSRIEACATFLAALVEMDRKARFLESTARFTDVGADALRRVEKAHGMLQEIGSNRPSLSDVADSVGWSCDHMRHMFRLVLGMSPIRVQRAAIIRHAQSLLRNETIRVGAVAELCGFTDVLYFSRVFKQETGVSPREYMSLIKNEAGV